MSAVLWTLEKKARQLAYALRPLSAERRMRYLLENHWNDAILTTSFGRTSAVLLDIASSIVPGIRVIYIRHGYENRETLDYIDWCEERFPIQLMIEQAPQLPLPPSREVGALRKYCEHLKVEPLRRALERERVALWISGIIHDETVERRELPLARVRYGRVAVYPILDWCLADAALYCESRNLRINANSFDPCKGPNQKLECGLHTASEPDFSS